MTLPFENDTSAITKKLAKRNVSENRIFCLFNSKRKILLRCP